MYIWGNAWVTATSTKSTVLKKNTKIPKEKIYFGYFGYLFIKWD